MDRGNQRKFLFFFCVAIFLFVSVVCWKMSFRRFSEEKIALGTFVKIDVCCSAFRRKKLDEALKDVWRRIDQISAVMNVYDSDSDVSRINHAVTKDVPVNQNLSALINLSKKYNRLTNGAFNIAVKPLLDLWKQARERKKIPYPDQITQRIGLLDNANILLKSGAVVSLAKKGMAIDLSAIAKGFAVDKAAVVLQENGFTDFYVDAGGDIYVSGLTCRFQKWRIGIRDPRDKSKILDILLLTDTAVTTSGGYEQLYEIEGKQFSHIIDPRSGYPEQEVLSATVIAPHTADADALATALSVLEPKEGIDLIDSLGPDYAAVVFYRDSESDFKKIASEEYKNFQRK